MCKVLAIIFFSLVALALVIIEGEARDCAPVEFACPNSTVCILNRWVCDGYEQCPGGEDELRPCPPCDKFTCDSGQCIESSWYCDWHADCTDGSDEVNCPPDVCEDWEFQCSSGRCIRGDAVCDGVAICDEELGCPCDGVQCVSNGECFPATHKCDGFKHCDDGSDEADCSNSILIPDVPLAQSKLLQLLMK